MDTSRRGLLRFIWLPGFGDGTPVRIDGERVKFDSFAAQGAVEFGTEV